MATQSAHKSRGIRAYGPGGVEIPHCTFTTSGTTAAVTVNEAQGMTISRTGVGTFTGVFSRTYKVIPNITFSVQAATTAQDFILTSSTTSGFVITQVTAGSGTATDALVARVNIIVLGRVNS